MLNFWRNLPRGDCLRLARMGGVSPLTWMSEAATDPSSARDRRVGLGTALILRSFAYLIFSAAVFLPGSVVARDWDDLNEPTLRGSEQEGRYTVDLFRGLIRYENWTNEKNQQRWMLNIFYLYRSTRYPKYRSDLLLLPLPFYSRHSLIDDRDLTIAPFFYREVEDGRYRNLITLYWSYGNTESGLRKEGKAPAEYAKAEEGNGIFPLYSYTSYTTKDGDERWNRFFLLPILSYAEWSKTEVVQAVPFVPFLYYYKHREATARSGEDRLVYLFPFYYRSTNTGDSIHENRQRIAHLIPLIWSKWDEQESFLLFLPAGLWTRSDTGDTKKSLTLFPIIPLLYFSSENRNGNDEDSFLFSLLYFQSFSKRAEWQNLVRLLFPFYYHEESANGAATWIFPTYVHTINPHKNAESVSLFPFYANSRYRTSSGKEDSSLWLFPYYSWEERSPNGQFDRGRFVLPFYYASDTESYRFRMVTPFYWSGTTRHPEPAANSVATADVIPDSGKAPDRTEATPGNTSDTESGWRFLPVPGITYFYDQAHSSWNWLGFSGHSAFHDGSRSVTYALPLLYSSYQKIPQGERSSFWFPLNLYHSLHDDATGTHEYHFIWPLISFYSSRASQEYGAFFFPLTAYRHWKDTEGEHSRLFLPVHYNHSVTKVTDNIAHTDSFIINPFYISSTSAVETATADLSSSNSPASTGKPTASNDSARADSTQASQSTQQAHYQGWRIIPLPFLYWKIFDDSGYRWSALLLAGASSWDENSAEETPNKTPAAPANSQTDLNSTNVRTANLDHRSSSYFVPFYYDSSHLTPDAQETYSRWAGLIYFSWRSDSSSGRTLLPFYYASDTERYRFRMITPFYWSGTHRHPPEAELTANTAATAQVIPDSGKAPDRTEATPGNTSDAESGWRFFPVPGITYVYDQAHSSWNWLGFSGHSALHDGSGSLTYALPLLYSSYQKIPQGERSSFWFPLNLYHSLHDDATGTHEYHFIWPLISFYSSRASQEYGAFFFPLTAYRHWKDTEGEHSRLFLPVHYNHSVTKVSDNLSRTDSFIINPLYIESTSLVETTIADLSSSNSPASTGKPTASNDSARADSTQSSQSTQQAHYQGWRIIPLPFLYWKIFDDSGYRWSAFLLMGASSWDENSTEETPNKTPAAPANSQTDSTLTNGRTANLNHRSSFYILPFYYDSSHLSPDAKETYRRWAGLIYFSWRSDSSSGRTLFPLFFFRDSDTSSFSMITPLYWSHQNLQTGETRRLGIPVYYDHTWTEGEHAYSTNWWLGNFSWNWKGSDGNINPFHFRWNDGEKEWELWFAGAYSGRSSAVRLERGGLYLDADAHYAFGLVSVSTRAPLYEPGLYKRLLDRALGNETERKKSRDTTALPPNKVRIVGDGTTVPGDEKPLPREPEGPRTEKGSTDQFARENVSAYLKVSVLFGWTSYIHADSKKHFRLLPLAWLTWDEADEKEKLTYYPLGYLDYQNGEERYHAVFPLFIPVYGKYEKGETFTEVWGGPLYIKSYDAEKKERELSIVWPFFKSYESPTEGGVRLIPIFAQRHWNDSDGDHRRTMSIVHYQHSVASETDSARLEQSNFFSPLYISAYSTLTDKNASGGEGGGGAGTVETGWSFFPIPLLTKTRSGDLSTYNIAFLMGWSSQEGSLRSSYFFPVYRFTWDDKNRAYQKQFLASLINVYSSETDRENGFYVFPVAASRHWTDEQGEHNRSLSLLHFSHSVKSEIDATAKEDWIFISPLFLHAGSTTQAHPSRTDTTTEGVTPQQNTSTTTEAGWSFYPLLPLPVLTHVYDEKHTSWNWLGLSGYSTQNDGSSYTAYFFPLFYRSSEKIQKIEQGGRIEQGERSSTWVLLNLYHTVWDDSTGTKEYHVLWPLLASYSAAANHENGFYAFPVAASRHWTDEQGEHNRSLSLLHFSHSVKSEIDATAKEDWVFISPLFLHAGSTTQANPSPTATTEGVTPQKNTGTTTEAGWSFYPLLPLPVLTHVYDEKHTSWNWLGLSGYSTQNDGSRNTAYFFPLFYRSSEKIQKIEQGGRIEQGERSSTWVLLNLYHTVRDDSTGTKEYHVLWPLLASYSAAANHENGFYVFPVAASRHWTDEQGEHNRSLSLLHFSHSVKSEIDATAKEDWVFISPLFLHAGSTTQANPSPTATTDGATAQQNTGTTTEAGWSFYPLLPLPVLTHVYDEKRTSWNWLGLSGYSTQNDGSSYTAYFFPLFYKSSEKIEQGEKSSLWVLLYHQKRDDSSQNYEHGLWPLMNVYSSMQEKESGAYLFPVAAYREWTDTEGEHTRFGSIPFYYHRATNRDGSRETSVWALLNLFHLNTYAGPSRNETDSYILWPFIRYQRLDLTQKDGSVNRERNWRFYPFFYNTVNGTGCQGDRCESDTRWTFFFPVLYSSREKDESTNWFLLYYNHSKGDATYHNLAYLFEYERTQRSIEVNGLLHAFHYENTDEFRKITFFYSILGDARWNHPLATNNYQSGYEARFLLYYQRDNMPENRSFKSALFPIWSYYSDEKEWSFFLLPALTYLSRSEKEAFDLWGLGLFRYRNRNDLQFQDTDWWLGGLLYRQNTNIENHYKIRGSVWGQLWSYETEEDTGWSRVTALLGLYVDVDRPRTGAGYRRILGIRFYKTSADSTQPPADNKQESP